MFKKHDMNKLRKKIASFRGPSFWRSLDELAQTDEFKQYLATEYPNGAMTQDNALSRRDFLKLMGASLVMLSFSGCSRQPLEKMVPYVKMPENLIPGRPLFFATAMTWNGHATGLLVESHMGRPTKVEGNPEHPDSLGATHAIHQAAVLGLYDPDRAAMVKKEGSETTWGAFSKAIDLDVKRFTKNAGDGLRLLTEAVISPTLHSQITAFLEKYPKARWYQYEPLAKDLARKAQKNSFGEYVDPLYDFSKAEVVLSFGSNFLVDSAGSLRYAKHFTKKRNVAGDNKHMSRFYAIESSPTQTSAVADHVLVSSTNRMEDLCVTLASWVGVKIPQNEPTDLTGKEHKWLRACLKDLNSHHGKSLVLAGENSPAIIQTLVHAINQKLGNTGKTVTFIPPVDSHPVEHSLSIKRLTGEMTRGLVDTLFIIGGNPVYNAPADLGFSKALAHVKNSIHLSLYEDETSALCRWQVPMAHFLEHFSDARASDGTVSIIQPLINPLYNGKSHHEILDLWLGRSLQSTDEIVKNYWRGHIQGSDFEKAWRKALHDGAVTGSAFKPKTVAAKTDFTKADWAELDFEKAPGPFEIIFRPDPSVWDGSFANNSWLQELPKPFTKLTWDNAALLSPSAAEKLGVSNEDGIEITLQGRTLKLPVWILPGQADHTISLQFGYGRKSSGFVGNGRGFNVYQIRPSSSLYNAQASSIKKITKKYSLASTQLHQSMEGRDLIRQGTLNEFTKNPDFAKGAHHGSGNGLLSFYEAHKKGDYAWGMSINLSNCIGCNACITACQSENNTPIVGKDEVSRGREMHWIRIDNYYEGSLDDPKIHQQPVMCMHCENAPCEPVCPVGATTHSDEGLNEMIYNRCAGTRYCSNNCPYKVRRFNFYDYASKKEPYKSMHNPDVTVRNRGVMEKCTFCVQRISHARIEAKKEGRSIRDGEIITACQGACPTEAITFGDLLDKKSRVSKLKHSPLNYGILTELNTQPRLTYLAKVKNPNPELAEPKGTLSKETH